MNPKKLLTFAQNPELALLNELEEANDSLKVLTQDTGTQKVVLEDVELITIKGEQGIQGEQGIAGEKGDVGPKGETGKTGERGADGKDSTVAGPKGEQGEQGEMGLPGTDGVDGKDGKDGSPDTGKEIVDKINELPIEDELQIGVEHIRGLIKELKDLRKLASTQTFVGGSGGKGHIKPYDISSQLNGVLKTFNLPANWTVISVVSTSFPNAFRPVIDYTFTPTTITFTSEITASSTLASGQSVIVIYEEA